MLFNSLDFLLFFPVVCLIYFVIPWLKVRNWFLLAASYYFYMTWEPVYALLLFSSTIITYSGALGIDKYRKNAKLLLTVCILLNIGILFLFKYYEFAAESIAGLMKIAHIDLPMPHFIFLLPVGISFYTLQSLSYTIDVYRGDVPIVRNFFRYALFVSFFPQLVAGPIERAGNLIPQFCRKQRFEYERVIQGVNLMVWGYVLKLVLADRCGIYVDAIYNNLARHNGGSYLLASILFSFQIYGDFAGYSLVAIGASRIMGFSLMENFRRPCLAVTVTDFWRRWHISLSRWLRDYVYIPLGGNRSGRKRTYRNLIATFGVSGLWHGADWTFVIWALIHGVIVSFERAIGVAKMKSGRIITVLRWIITFMIISLSRVFFRANNLSEALGIFKGMITNPGIPFLRLADFGAIALGLTVVFIKEYREEKNLKPYFRESAHWALNAIYLSFTVCFVILFGVLNGDQYIYFQF